MNYIFTIADLKTNDQYLARVYVTLSKQASIEEISKNGLSIKKSTALTNNQLFTTSSAQ
jgi:hypothetical protein